LDEEVALENREHVRIGEGGGGERKFKSEKAGRVQEACITIFAFQLPGSWYRHKSLGPPSQNMEDGNAH